MRPIQRMIAGLALGISVVAVPVAAQHFSDSFTFLKAVRDRDGNAAQPILSNSANAAAINSQDDSTGEGALHIVTRRRDLTWLQAILGAHARPDIQMRDGTTPLGIAATIGWVEGAQALIQAGADVNKPNNHGETPLILAVHGAPDPTLIRLLLSHGADPRRTDSVAGYSALDYARQDPRTAAIARILEAQRTPNAQIAAPHP